MPASAKLKTKSNPHLGSSLDSFLEEEGLLDDAEAVAIKRAIALQLSDILTSARLSKSEAAGRLKTSRAAVDRLLDPNNTSVTLLTLNRAARALGRRLKIQLVRD
jgi:antitoxin HicB